MRIGCCTNMIAAGPDGTGVEYVEKLAELGFDYIELPLAEMTALSDADFDALAKRVSDSGIRCESCNNFFPKTIRLTGPDVDDAAIDAYVAKALARADRMGAGQVVFGSGPAKNVPDGSCLEDGYRQVVRLLKRIAPVAERYGIIIAIEPLRRVECNLINSFEEGCRLAGDVAHDNVRVLVDYYHLAQEDEPASNVARQGAEYLTHVHFARNDGRGFPRNSAEDDGYRPFFAALSEAGYDARVSLEAYTSSFAREAPEALAFFRETFRNTKGGDES